MSKNENEEVVATNIGYPYDVLPKGYPTKISNKTIEEVIEKVLHNLKRNAGLESVVNRDAALINLGLNELNNRINRKQSRIAFWLSILSVIFAGFSLIISVLSFCK